MKDLLNFQNNLNRGENSDSDLVQQGYEILNFLYRTRPVKNLRKREFDYQLALMGVTPSPQNPLNSENLKAMSKGYCFIYPHWGSYFVKCARSVREVFENRMKIAKGETFRGIKLHPEAIFPSGLDDLEILISEHPIFDVQSNKIDKWLKQQNQLILS